MHRRRAHLDQHLVGLDLRHVDLAEPQHIVGRAVPLLDDCLHREPRLRRSVVRIVIPEPCHTHTIESPSQRASIVPAGAQVPGFRR
jgi:hypothetical protein